MKKTGTGIALIAGIGLGSWWISSHQPKKLSAEAPPSIADMPSVDDGPTPPRSVPVAKVPSNPADPDSSVKPDNTMNEEEFIRLFRETDFTQSMPTALLVEAIESSWSSDTPQFFINALESLADSDPNERGRLVFLANELRSPELTGFWSKVLERSPAGFPNEAELLAAREPNLSTMSLRNELSTALRNLGVSAFRQEAARGALQKYVRTVDPTMNNTIVRKDAYYRLREANPTQAARSLSALAKDDPLRRELELN